MRVIAGRYRGLTLVGPKAKSRIRPTTDRVREALFSRITRRVAESRFLDLFAGTGAVGIEAASRGAASVCFVEMAGESVAIIRSNLARLQHKPTVTVKRRKVEAFLGGGPESYDLVFCDPPYGYDLVGLAQRLADAGVVAREGLLVVEHESADDGWWNEARWRLDVRKEYGDTCLTYLVPVAD